MNFSSTQQNQVSTKPVNVSKQSNSDSTADASRKKVAKTVESNTARAEEAYVFNEKKIFVGGIKRNLRKSAFLTYFEQFGQIVGLDYLQKRKSLLRRGFCFLIFEEKAVVDDILKKRIHVIDGVEIECKVASPKQFSCKQENTLSVTDEDYQRALVKKSLELKKEGSNLTFEFFRFVTLGELNVFEEFKNTIEGLELEMKVRTSKKRREII